MNRYVLAALAVVFLALSHVNVAGATTLPPEELDDATAYTFGAVALGALNIATSAINLNSHADAGSPGWSAYAGAFGGLLGIALGGAMLSERYDYETLGVTSVVLGTAATIAGFSAMRQAKNKSQAVAPVNDESDRLTVAPTIHLGQAPGLGVSMRF